MLYDLIPTYDPALFAKIHGGSTFLPREENEDSVRCILLVIGVITALHLVLLGGVKLWQRSGKDDGGVVKSSDEKKASALKASVSC